MAMGRSFAKASVLSFCRRPPQDPISKRRLVTEAIHSSTLAGANTFSLTGMLFETESKLIIAWCTVGPALWPKRTIFFSSKREVASILVLS